MNNNYIKFNEWAYQYYLERNSISNIGTLAIEVNEIENYCKEYDCDLKFSEIKEYDWSKLLHQENNNIPKYFGLIAIQCYAASKMQYDGNAGVNDYQTRFIEVSGITNTQELQNKFKSEFLGVPIQEKIWIEAKKILSNINIEICIPDQSNGPGRYVQYPKKQVVLNQEDLKEYFDIFKEIEFEFEELSFNEFQRYFKNNIDRYHFERTNNLINNRPENENNIKIKQVFDFYCSENWRDLKKSITIFKDHNQFTKYILFYNELEEDKIKLYKDESTKIFFCKNLFVKNLIKGIVFFKKSEEYNNEYDYTDSLEEGKEYILVTNNNFSLDILKKIKDSFEVIDFDLGDYSFFKGKIDKNKMSNEFLELIKETYPIEVIGVKVSQKKQYLINFPPIIKNSKNVNYRVHPEYNSSDVKLGKYQIKIPGYSNLNFEIIDIPKLNGIVHSRKIGLTIKNLKIVETNYNVQGLQYSGVNSLNEENLNINNWIDAQTTKIKMKTSNIILKALIQSNYGK